MPDHTRTRLCLVSDIEKYSKHTTTQQADAQRRLSEVMRFACANAGVYRVSRRFRQDRGDGVLILLPPRMDPAAALPGLVLGLRHGLHRANREPGEFGRLRLRVAVAQGSAGIGATGFTGPAPIEACRLVDARRLKDLLARQAPGDLAFIMTDALYQDVGRRDPPGLWSAQFQRVDVAEDKYRGVGWACVPPRGPVAVSVHDAGNWSAVRAVAAGVAVAGPAAHHVERQHFHVAGDDSEPEPHDDFHFATHLSAQVDGTNPDHFHDPGSYSDTQADTYQDTYQDTYADTYSDSSSSADDDYSSLDSSSDDGGADALFM